jgi:hypothetical protein
VTEVDFADALNVAVSQVRERRAYLGMQVGRDYEVQENGLYVYTATGIATMRASFGVRADDLPATGDIATPEPPEPQECGKEALCLENAPVVMVKVLRARPNEQCRNNRHFMVIVVDAQSRQTSRVLNMFVPRGGINVRRGQMLKALDMGEQIVLDRRILRKRGEIR